MDEPRDILDELFAQARCRDEILEVLYWLAGEGFEREMTPSGVARFLARPEDELLPAVEHLVRSGLVARTGDAAGGERYALTAAGRREGARRFAEGFAGFAARDAHAGACDDPDCDCRSSREALVSCLHERGRLLP